MTSSRACLHFPSFLRFRVLSRKIENDTVGVATERGVALQTVLGDLADWAPEPGSFDAKAQRGRGAQRESLKGICAAVTGSSK